jgi:glycosyltransferase involved in cell wall biosynthesis
VGLSILLPAHDASRTIGLALVSTILFKPKGAEVIILLDGDNTRSKWLSFLGRRSDVRVLRTPHALGISGALNLLIRESRFDLIARMDADDICLPGRFKRAMRDIRLRGFDFVFTHIVFFGSSVKPFGLLPQLPVSLSSEEAKWMLWLDNPYAHPTLVARKSSLLELGGYRNIICEDLDLWLRAQTSDYRFKRLSRYGLLYRRHEGQLTQRKFQDAEQTRAENLLLAARSKFEEYLRSQPGVDESTDLDEWAKGVLTSTNLGYRVQNSIIKRLSSIIRAKV